MIDNVDFKITECIIRKSRILHLYSALLFRLSFTQIRVRLNHYLSMKIICTLITTLSFNVISTG